MLVVARKGNTGAVVAIVMVLGKSSLLFYLARHTVAVSDT